MRRTDPLFVKGAVMLQIDEQSGDGGAVAAAFGEGGLRIEYRVVGELIP